MTFRTQAFTWLSYGFKAKTLPTLLFLAWTAILYQKVDVWQKLHHRPVGEHVWAQTDRASMALTYHMDKASFWLPRCHSATNDPEGITAGEFPLIPFVVSKMYDAWGFDEFYHRLFVLALSLLGFVMAYLLMGKLVGSYWWASIITSLWLASPNIIFYSFSFLPDLPSLTFGIIALYCLFRKKEVPSTTDILFFSVFLTLSGLLKLSGLVVTGAATFGLIMGQLPRFHHCWKRLVPAMLIPTLLIGAWVIYARHLLEVYGIFTFLLQPLPPSNFAELIDAINTFTEFSQLYYIQGFWWFLAGAFLLAVFFAGKQGSGLLMAAASVFVGFSMMFVLLYEKSPHHMYYWLPFQLGILFLLGWIFKNFNQRVSSVWMQRAVFVGMLVMVNYCAIHVQKNVRNRWKADLELLRPYYDLEPRLDELGIHYGDRVLSYQDESPNTTLYLINRKGWALDENDPKEDVMRAIGSCDYAIINSWGLAERPDFKQYFYRQIATENGLIIYNLHADKGTDR